MHLSNYFLDLVENALCDLESGKCVAIEEDMDLKPLNFYLDCFNYNNRGIWFILTYKTRITDPFDILEYSQNKKTYRNIIISDNWEFDN